MPTSPLRRRAERGIGLLVALQLSVAIPTAILLEPAPSSVPSSSSSEVRESHALRGSTTRTLAVRELLDRRERAVLEHDRQAFLNTVDPTQRDFLARQAALFEAFQDVPFSSWTYELDAVRERPHRAELDERHGTWWAPEVTLRYGLTGFDRAPTYQPQGLTFSERAGQWYLAADDDFAADGHPTTRDLWDGGKVEVQRGSACLVLAHPAKRRLADQLLKDCQSAVPRVTAVWGTEWLQRVVVLVPSTGAELERVVTDAGDLTNIAAVATADLVDPATGFRPVGDRVVVNPAAFADLGSLGRRVILAHEITHVASRTSTGPQLPTWLAEGLADYIGYLGVNVAVPVIAEELRDDIRRGKVPKALPTNSDFSDAQSDLPQLYEQSWLAVSLLVSRYGEAKVLALYRHVGSDPAEDALHSGFQTYLGTSVEAFTELWRADLLRRLS